ncbi:MAG: pyridoxamine 5'-phosphate oxidase family protein [Gemmatimonadota bacterium]|nr:pyridoxamine 5'-phosphate oxidase family protein [Gemmatimonadota bacterium]
MATMSKDILEAWENREGPAVLATVDGDGTPNIIYVTCVGAFSNDSLVVADNYFDKTRKNIKQGSKGSILFISKEGKAYQVKGNLEYHNSGEIFDFMKSWNPSQHPGHAAAVLRVEEVFSGAEKLCED